jgi:hypothetical protein
LGVGNVGVLFTPLAYVRYPPLFDSLDNYALVEDVKHLYKRVRTAKTLCVISLSAKIWPCLRFAIRH